MWSFFWTMGGEILFEFPFVGPGDIIIRVPLPSFPVLRRAARPALPCPHRSSPNTKPFGGSMSCGRLGAATNVVSHRLATAQNGFPNGRCTIPASVDAARRTGGCLPPDLLRASDFTVAYRKCTVCNIFTPPQSWFGSR